MLVTYLRARMRKHETVALVLLAHVIAPAPTDRSWRTCDSKRISDALREPRSVENPRSSGSKANRLAYVDTADVCGRSGSLLHFDRMAKRVASERI